MAEQGDEIAQGWLGIAFREKGDYASAIKWLQPLAEQGNEDAQGWLGMYFFEKGDMDSAIKWLKPLAEQGNETVQRMIEDCFSYKEEYYDADANKLNTLMDQLKANAIDSKELEQILVKYKQYIYKKVYWVGTANSLKIVEIDDDTIKVSINWTSFFNKGVSVIGLDYRGGELGYYEISEIKESNPTSLENAQTAAAWAAAISGLLTILNSAQNSQ